MKTLVLIQILLLVILFLSCSSSTSADMGGGVKESDYGYNEELYPGTEESEYFGVNPFVLASIDNQSTFGLDVDKASYTFHRKKVMEYSTLPDKEAVRVEEFINFFDYSYPLPTTETFSITTQSALSPFKDSVVNLVVGLKGKVSAPTERKPWNLTFLVDISGSMSGRMELVKESLGFLVDGMQSGDKISIGTYAGGIETILTPTAISQKDKATIKGIISEFQGGGGTAMGDGLENAYRLNQSGFISNGVNRVIVCSDGDANIGESGWEEMLKRVEEFVDQGITLTTLGFGLGNYKDSNMEMLANRGNGNYYYIDSQVEAKRLFTDELISVMTLIASDARIQITFDKSSVKSYRLLGYENRDIEDDAFDDDTTDAGEVGEGHTVTAVYELVLHEAGENIGTIALRYKDDKGAMVQQDVVIPLKQNSFDNMSPDFKFAVVVAEYAEILRQSKYTETAFHTLIDVMSSFPIKTSEKRREFSTIVSKAAALK